LPQNNPPTPLPSAEQHRRSLARLRRFASLMDSRFRIPGLGVRLGWDGLIGLIPGIGDLLGALLSGYVVVEAIRLKAPRALIGRMGLNILAELLGGLLPVLGDLFDIYWKANQRNVQLLESYIEKRIKPPSKQRPGLLTWFLVGVLAVCALYLFLIYTGKLS